MQLSNGARSHGTRHIAAMTVAALCGLGIAGAAGPAAAATRTLAAPAAVRVLASGPAAPAAAAVSAAGPTTPGSIVPQGPLAADGTRVVTCSAACDLWAQSGIWASGSANVPIYGFTANQADQAAAVGPTLLVDKDSTVTITVHNALPVAQDLSLAIPGMTGLAPDMAGVPLGGSKAYSFTASRPGTYLYEAGHTPNGARQSAMGLTGVLVVRGAASTAGKPTAYSSEGSAYDDEAVLALTEIDPALNNNPLGFDLRAFAPKYRLIDGKTFPQTNEIATDIGRTVLLRYVNAGTQNHAMGLLGVEQTVIGEDGHPSAAPTQLVSTTVSPGQAVDTLVTMPTTEAKYPLIETEGQLNDAGSTDTAGQQAFGGMLTFLDTNAAPASGDIFGPASSAVGVSPSTALITDNLTVTANFSDAAAGGSAVTQAEYVIDDPTLAVGDGVPFSGGSGQGSVTWTGATSVTPVAGLRTLDPTSGLAVKLTAGRHVVYVRALDIHGNWGPIGSAVFQLKQTGPVTTGVTAAPSPTNGRSPVAVSATGDDTAFAGTVMASEYYLDNDPGQGLGIPMTQNRQTVTVDERAMIPAATIAPLSEGPHKVYVRSKDNLGLWGDPVAATISVDTTAPDVAGTPYATPSPNNGTLGSSVDPGQLQILATFADATSTSNLVAAEGFVDNPNGVTGSGLTFLARDGLWNSPQEDTYGLVPLSEFTGYAEGTHQVYVHAEDAAGNWGPLTPVPFVVDKHGPAITAGPAVAPGTATLTASATDNLSPVVAAEFFTGADPGVGAATGMTVTANGVTADLSASLVLPRGTFTFSVRAKDAAGNWGPVTAAAVAITPPPLFADGFEGGLVPPWSAVTGAATITAAAKLTGAAGLSVTTGNTTRPAYVTDTTPNAEPTYHAGFQFKRNTLNVQGQTVTVFRALNAANAQVFAVQYRRIGGNAYQMRLAINRAGGAVTGTPWVAAPDAGVTVQVDWTGGRLGTATLTVNGVARTVTGVNTGTLRVDTVQLGLVQTARIAGIAFFDTFTSNR